MSDTKLYKLPDAAINNKWRAVSIAKVYNHPVALTKSSEVASALTLSEIKELYQKLIRVTDNGSIDLNKRAFDGSPHASVIDYLYNGGTSALSYCRQILKQEGILKTYEDEITNAELNSEDKVVGHDVPIQKQHNEELMQVTYVAMMPDFTDLHGDYTSEDEVRKAKESFNKSAMRANLFHRMMTDKFSVIESYLAPTDFILNEIPVKKGTWLMTFQIHDDNLWKMIKSGDINGISIAGMAKAEYVKETE